MFSFCVSETLKPQVPDERSLARHEDFPDDLDYTFSLCHDKPVWRQAKNLPAVRLVGTSHVSRFCRALEYALDLSEIEVMRSAFIGKPQTEQRPKLGLCFRTIPAIRHDIATAQCNSNQPQRKTTFHAIKTNHPRLLTGPDNDTAHNTLCNFLMADMKCPKSLHSCHLSSRLTVLP